MHVGENPDRGEALAEEAVTLMEATGKEPVARFEQGSPHRAIVELANSTKASLVVVGSRGMTGVRALGSVSERVAHRAPCSVLIVRRTAHPQHEPEHDASQRSVTEDA